jgi:hypothetical protein
MNKVIIVFLLTMFTFSTSLYADEKKCKIFELVCKSKKFINDTKEFQNKGLDQTVEQLKNTKIK